MDRTNNLMAAPASILVINVSRIGDTLLVTPALRALAEAWPQARITFLGHPKRAEIMENLPFLANVGGITKYRARWKGWLPGRRYDLALVFGFDKPLVAYALREAHRVVALKQGDAKLDSKLFQCVEPPPFQSLHSALLPLLLTRSIGVPDAGGRLSYTVAPHEDQRARAKLATALGAKQNARPLIGLQVASFPTKGYRDWPLEHFEALCKRILERWPNAHFLILGGSLEKNRTEALARRFSDHATLFAGKLTLRESAALMNLLDLYIGVDTGPTHIMGALHRPMIALYHCYSPSRLLAPLEHPCCYAIDHPRAAEGCGPETPMAEITVDTVWGKVVEALETARTRGERAPSPAAHPN
ncbi:MAG TPA: glycosyltransferase family 9 protein [Burkholderiales bacterium]|nr:glycosyltransferase family 9 protein [Burkholderiales bacterium]